ncbi:8-amino-7-oxononanoate synthase [Nocardioides jiangxiensis]|uniref:8-amino-7-oxononanoate synthase n=1 Tax=Nocardioides jiangxiensis TaxID=3064524 RepID=A0ABT9B752_9ACTN|nr:8-amino-7-oxononanoate synthase [Nocardioides sp. WY-20]MDO7869131.1 8-amino-7-oxononanoate synthase [Nocardioides sp. WY-20]
MSWEQWFSDRVAEREAAGLRRVLRPRGAHDPVIDLAGNDYLGLSTHPDVRRAAADAALTWGAGAGASRLVTGTLEVHQQLEDELAELAGWPAALAFSTGYHANLSVVAALVGRGDLIVSDAHVHASLIDAARLSRAEVAVAAHNDAADVARILTANPGRRTLVLVESIYSVLGDAAPLEELAAICAAHGALLVVDEAHGVGVVGDGGRGLVHAAGLAGHPHVVVTVTLSKAMGAQGGVLLGPASFREHLVNAARPFIFDTGLAPASAAGALASLRHLRAHPDLPAVIRTRVGALADALAVEAPAGAVLSVPMPSPQAALAAQAAILDEGVRVACFRPPSVPDGISRLRITTNAGVPDADWARATEVVTRIAKEHR